jgi:type IV secretion system protein TrbL
MFLAWLVVILCFFVLAIQLFITLIEFKLTTLAGFVLVPFALWNKTAFLAEKVLGNVVSSGIKVLVLAVIVGIGSGLFAEFRCIPEPSIDHALVVMLASLTLLALGIFGPGIATGLVSGAPQLGAGAMAGAALGAAGAAVAVGAAATGVGGAVAAGARMAPLPPSWPAAVRVPPRPPAAPVGVPGRFRFGRRRPQGRGRWRGQCRQDRRAGGRAEGGRWRALDEGAWPLPSGPMTRRRRRRAGAAQPRQPSNPPGPSACIAASSSPMPRPPPPTRCAAATAAAPAKARACAIPIHQGELPCDSNDRRCATPTRRSLPPRTNPPPRCGTSASARPACRRRTGASWPSAASRWPC